MVSTPTHQSRGQISRNRMRAPVTSIIKDQMKPPHAHITQVKGDKTAYKGVKKRKRHTNIGSIFQRKTLNLNKPLLQRQEFSEVKEAFRRVRDIRQGRNYHHTGASVDNSKPGTFSLTKKITENKRSNQFHMTEHVHNLASL